MLKGKGFRNIGRVEVKAETTTPGDATHRRRRSVAKMEFVIEETGAVIKGQSKFSLVLSFNVCLTCELM